MIVGFSTSSAWASVATIDPGSRRVIWQGSENAPQGASGACLDLLQKMIEETGVRLEDAELFAADIGPGSFTGVRVGVTLAKTFGHLYSRPVAGASSFDLIAVDQIVVVPSKKGEFFIRVPGQLPVRSADLPSSAFLGFGPGIDPQVFPDASRFFDLLGLLEPVSASEFIPEYLIEPSISTPKKPFASRVGPGG